MGAFVTVAIEDCIALPVKPLLTMHEQTCRRFRK